MKPVLTIVNSPFTTPLLAEVKAVAPEYEVRTVPPRTDGADLADTEILFGLVKDPSVLQKAVKLRWHQTPSAGVDPYCRLGVYHTEEVVLTNSSGAYGIGIAEHLVTMTLVLLRRVREYDRKQQAHDWSAAGPLRSLYGATVLIVGLGDIGGEFAARLRPFGCRIIGVRRSGAAHPLADETITPDRLPHALGRADVVALCLPETAETKRLFDRQMFAHCKRGAVLLNVGRGSALELGALKEALDDGLLSGAALDVTDPEPLPQDSPLWDMQQVFITPHMSGGNSLDGNVQRIGRLFLDNLARYRAGEPLHQVVDRKAGY